MGRNKRTGPAVRKERRKVGRIQKKARNLLPKSVSIPKTLKQRIDVRGYSGSEEPSSDAKEHQSTAAAEPTSYPKSILKHARPSAEPNSRDNSLPSRSPSPPFRVRVSQSTKDRLAADDAEIAALERALGVKGKKNLPKAFEDDGLDELLGGLQDTERLDEASLGKRKRRDGDDWLEMKRQKALGASQDADEMDTGRSSPGDVSDNQEEGLSGSDLGDDGDSMEDDVDEATSFGESNEDLSTAHTPTQKVRENPYVAPVASDAAAPAKYVPPSPRDAESQSEEMLRLRRKIQGLLNRLSEANIVSILGDVEKLYRDHPRQYVSTTLLDLLMGLLCDPTSLQDTFIILHAGFIAAIYKVMGMDFGAQAIQRIDEEFVRGYRSENWGDSKGKRLINLINLLSELYNFQVIGSNLIYDLIRLFLEDLTETNAELLLKIMRSKLRMLIVMTNTKTTFLPDR